MRLSAVVSTFMIIAVCGGCLATKPDEEEYAEDSSSGESDLLSTIADAALLEGAALLGYEAAKAGVNPSSILPHPVIAITTRRKYPHPTITAHRINR